VKAEAAAAVDAAVRAKLSWGFQLRVYLKLAKADGMIDAAFRDVDLHTPAPGPFDLNYGTAPGSAYRIDATLAVADDPCEAESLRVRSLRQTVANAEAALAKLLAHEAPTTRRRSRPCRNRSWSSGANSPTRSELLSNAWQRQHTASRPARPTPPRRPSPRCPVGMIWRRVRHRRETGG
jgi:hypothetical protein